MIVSNRDGLQPRRPTNRGRDTGETALHLASNDDVARELFAAKASPDVADHLGAKASDVRCGASGLSKYENEN